MADVSPSLARPNFLACAPHVWHPTMASRLDIPCYGSVLRAQEPGLTCKLLCSGVEYTRAESQVHCLTSLFGQSPGLRQKCRSGDLGCWTWTFGTAVEGSATPTPTPTTQPTTQPTTSSRTTPSAPPEIDLQYQQYEQHPFSLNCIFTVRILRLPNPELRRKVSNLNWILNLKSFSSIFCKNTIFFLLHKFLILLLYISRDGLRIPIFRPDSTPGGVETIRSLVV